MGNEFNSVVWVINKASNKKHLTKTISGKVYIVDDYGSLICPIDSQYAREHFQTADKYTQAELEIILEALESKNYMTHADKAIQWHAIQKTKKMLKGE